MSEAQAQNAHFRGACGILKGRAQGLLVLSGKHLLVQAHRTEGVSRRCLQACSGSCIAVLAGERCLASSIFFIFYSFNVLDGSSWEGQMFGLLRCRHAGMFEEEVQQGACCASAQW